MIVAVVAASVRKKAGKTMIDRHALPALPLSCHLGLSTPPAPLPAFAKGSVNLRAGPGTNHARIATIPAGAPLNVLRCGRWCEVIYAGRKGWVTAAYVAPGDAPRGGSLMLPDKSLCQGPGVWGNPYCQWPIEESARDFSNSTREFNRRQDHSGGGGRGR